MTWGSNETHEEMIAKDLNRVRAMLQENKALRTRLFTEYALGFKAGIEAAAEVAHDYGNKRGVPFATYASASIRDEISSLPTPPSILPEILEAMRPFAVTDTAWNGEPDSLVIELRGVDDEPQPCVHLGDIRRLVAVVTKLGGTHD